MPSTASGGHRGACPISVLLRSSLWGKGGPAEEGLRAVEERPTTGQLVCSVGALPRTGTDPVPYPRQQALRQLAHEQGLAHERPSGHQQPRAVHCYAPWAVCSG
jgi:hypothetical protein